MMLNGPPNQYGSKDEGKMTYEELKKIETAMKKPEFYGLLSDYMQEVSNPQNKEVADGLIIESKTTLGIRRIFEAT